MLNPNNTISQRTARKRRLQSAEGELSHSSYLDRCKTLINRAPQARQIVDVVVDTAANSTDYTLTLESVVFTITSGPAATKQEIAEAFITKISADPVVRGKVAATLNGTDKVRLTSTHAGLVFVVTEGDANLSLASVQSAAEAAPVPFGRLLITQGVAETPVAGMANTSELCAVAQASLLTAQVDTLTIPFVASVEVFIDVTVEGQTYKAAATTDTDAPTTLTALAALLNALLPANTVEVTSDATKLTFTAELAGKAFQLSFGCSNDSASVPALVHTTNAGVMTDINRAAAGLSVRRIDEQAQTIGDASTEYQPNEGVAALEDGGMWVRDTAQAATFGAPVYVELDSASADKGLLFTTASATRARLDIARWERPAAEADLALSEVRFRRAI